MPDHIVIRQDGRIGAEYPRSLSAGHAKTAATAIAIEIKDFMRPFLFDGECVTGPLGMH